MSGFRMIGHKFRTADRLRHISDELHNQKVARDTALIRGLLTQWVSEHEPSVAVDQDGEIIGLCIEGDTSGRIVVMAPGRVEMAKIVEERGRKWRWPWT